MKHTPPEKIVKQVVTKEIPVPKEIVEEEVEPPAEVNFSQLTTKFSFFSFQWDYRDILS